MNPLLARFTDVVMSAASDPVPNTVLGLLAAAIFSLAGTLGLLGKSLLTSNEKAHASKDAMADKILDKAVPAMDAMTAMGSQIIEVMKEQSRQLALERDTRIRLQAELDARERLDRHPEGH